MINIQSLTPQQAAICEILWGCDHIDQVTAFINGLPIDVRPVANALVQVIQIEAIDESITDTVHCADAVLYLNKFNKRS